MDGASKGAPGEANKGRLRLARLNESKLAAGSSRATAARSPRPWCKDQRRHAKAGQEWYDKATCSQRIGEGKFGETRWYNDAITPIGNYVAIKRFKDLTPTGRQEAKDEAEYHKCGKTQLQCQHLAEPAG